MAVEAPKWAVARAEPAPFRRRGVRSVADAPLEDMVSEFSLGVVVALEVRAAVFFLLV